MSPLCESYLTVDRVDQMEPFYPLHVWVCAECLLVQINDYVRAEEIFTELRVHTTIEEDVFYPEVRQGDDELEDTVAEGLEEHHVVDVLMAEAEALTPGEEAWVAKLTVLIENVEHHAGEEESELFPEVRRVYLGI